VDPRQQATIAAYDEAAAAYFERWQDHRPRDAAKRFAALAGRGAVVCDLACGPGVDLRVLRDAGVTVVAGDAAPSAMRLARTYFPKGALAQWDFRRLPVAPASFDGVWACAALEHVPLAELRPTLAEVVRVQRRGPIFCCFREGRCDLQRVEDDPAEPVYATAVTAEELQALLLEAGYRRVEIERRPDLRGRAEPTWLHAFGQLPAEG
jgi:ubiquinone/menaquinone biosynthesis C-methylase UbiE